MTDKLIVFVTCENREQAERIAQSVVQEKLAACVNVLPPIRSCYVWEGKLTWSEEILLLIKTTTARFSQLEERIRALHTYEVPEIIGVPVEDGIASYLQWIERAVGA